MLKKIYAFIFYLIQEDFSLIVNGNIIICYNSINEEDSSLKNSIFQNVLGRISMHYTKVYFYNVKLLEYEVIHNKLHSSRSIETIHINPIYTYIIRSSINYNSSHLIPSRLKINLIASLTSFTT